MKISVLSERTGLAVSALRFYEGQGLLQSGRTPSNYRDFPESAIAQVRRIQNFRALGLGLSEIRYMLTLTLSMAMAPQEDCALVCDVIQRNLSQVRRQLKELKQLEQELTRLATLCSGRPGPNGCKILREFEVTRVDPHPT